jgi:predicted transcriptional regulator
MATRKDVKRGEFVQERKPADVLAVMRPLEPYMTSEIADELGWSRRSAYNVLTRLHESDEIRKKKPEARRVIWIRPE